MDMRLQREHAAAAALAWCCCGLLPLTAGISCICCTPWAAVLCRVCSLGLRLALIFRVPRVARPSLHKVEG